MKLFRFLWQSLSSSYELRSFTFLFVLIYHISLVWRGNPYSEVENFAHTVLLLIFGYGFGLYYHLLFGPGYLFKRLPGTSLLEMSGVDLTLRVLLYPSTLVCLIIFIHILGAAFKGGGLTNWVLAACALVLGPAGAFVGIFTWESLLLGDICE